MTGPRDELAAAAGGPGHLRASHADREQVIDTLKMAFALGRLTKGELDDPVVGQKRREHVRKLALTWA